MSTEEIPAARRAGAAVRYIPDYKLGSPEQITEELFVAVLEATTFLGPSAAAGQPARTVEQHIAAILRA